MRGVLGVPHECAPQWHILPVPCCVLSWEVRLVKSWGGIFLESSAKESQVWGMEPTQGWERGSQCAGADVPSSSGDHGDLHEAPCGDQPNGQFLWHIHQLLPDVLPGMGQEPWMHQTPPQDLHPDHGSGFEEATWSCCGLEHLTLHRLWGSQGAGSRFCHGQEPPSSSLLSPTRPRTGLGHSCCGSQG